MVKIQMNFNSIIKYPTQIIGAVRKEGLIHFSNLSNYLQTCRYDVVRHLTLSKICLTSDDYLGQV